MLVGTQLKEYFVPSLVGVALFIGFSVNVITKRNMCHHTGQSFDLSQITDMLQDHQQ